MLRKKNVNGFVNMPQHYDLSKLLSIAISSMKFSSLQRADIHSVINTIGKVGLKAVREIHIYNFEDTSKPFVDDFSSLDPSTIDKLFNKRISGVLDAKQARFSVLMNLRLPFVDCDAQLDFYHWQKISRITIQVGQDPFLEGREGPYKQDKLDILKKIACFVFCNIQCIAGIISTQDNIFCTNIEETFDKPPVNWAYWSNEILQRVPEKLLLHAKNTALKIDDLQNFGIFWIWSDFGEAVDQGKLQHMKMLRNAISAALRERLL